MAPRLSWTLALGLVACGPNVETRPCPEPPDTEQRSPREPRNETSFLPLLADDALRDELWSVYVEVEPIARRFAPERWTPIRLVLASDRALWWTTGLIEIPVAQDDQGALVHELFHGAYHHSALNTGRDAAWGEGFADAFRYLIERDVMGGEISPWRREMERLAALTPEERLVLSRRDETVRTYSNPALLILERAQWDLERFEAMWFELAARRRAERRDILNDVFGQTLGGA